MIIKDYLSLKTDQGHDFRYAIDFSNLESTGWKPIFTLEESLEEIINWYQKNKSWWEVEFQNTLENRNKRFKLSN